MSDDDYNVPYADYYYQEETGFPVPFLDTVV
jgi:hypothetical protein